MDPFFQYNINENNARKNFYGVSPIPRLYIDGTDAGGDYAPWEGMFTARANEPSDWGIVVNGFYNNQSRNASINIDVFLESQNPSGTEFFRIALVESDIYFRAPNGIDIHNQTFRDLIPDANGIEIVIDDYGVFRTSVDFDVDSEVVTDNSEIVFFIQSSSGKEILQGFKVPFSELTQSSVDEDNIIPEKTSLLGNYPNPFNSSTTIRYALSSNMTVQLDIFNIAGQKIETLVNGKQEKGVQIISWNASEYPSGIYLYRLKTNSTSVTRRMVLLK
ncbi:MAG: T9SS type A sorting domain-containing protein [candidate division Zixibacteria bacterium]|nr:T9SS type A sorting domain-containing protein [candidate division Zixibacteria bacterium]